MYKKRYYDATPNREIIANQAHSFFFPITATVSNHLTRTYDYSEEDLGESDYKVHNHFPDIDKDSKGEMIDIHSILDYTMLNDENCINLQMLFSEPPTKDNYNVVQQMRLRGVFPNPLADAEVEE